MSARPRHSPCELNGATYSFVAPSSPLVLSLSKDEREPPPLALPQDRQLRLASELKPTSNLQPPAHPFIRPSVHSSATLRTNPRTGRPAVVTPPRPSRLTRTHAVASARTDAAGARPLAGAERLATALAVAALIALPFVIYWRSLSDFFMLDDFIWLKAAAGHGAIDLLRRETSFSTPLDPFDYPTPYIRPLVDAYFFVTWRIFGLDPRAYHALNLALHACVGLAVAVLGWQLLRSKVAGLLGAALFLALPTYDFAVTWVSEATDLIFTLFYLLSLSLFLAHLRRAPPAAARAGTEASDFVSLEPPFPARPEALEGRPGGAGATRASSFAASVRHEAPGSTRPEPAFSARQEPAFPARPEPVLSPVEGAPEGRGGGERGAARLAGARGAPYFASLAAFTLALLAKEPAITLAGVAALAAFAQAE